MKKTAKLLTGWAMADITPEQQVALMGQFHDRFSTGVRDPLTATVLALESVDESGVCIDQAVMISCDLVMINAELTKAVKMAVAQVLPDLDSDKILLSATHTHTGPYFFRTFELFGGDVFGWPDYNKDILPPEDYFAFLCNRICAAVTQAWQARTVSGVSQQLGHAVIGHNRRVTYDDGTNRMYGNTDTIHYRGPEGPDDNGIEMMYFWNQSHELTGLVINVACPSQVVEGKEYISADYWGETRQKIWAKYGKQVHVLGLCGAAGDLSPRDMARRGRGEANMRDEAGLFEIADKLLMTVEYKFDKAKENVNWQPVLRHSVRILPLPYRKVSKTAYEKEKARADAIISKYRLNGKKFDKKVITDSQDLVDLYEAKGAMARFSNHQAGPVYNMEAHFLRLGDAALATNPFELYTVYGLMVKARSVAMQTFIVQLACDCGGYLATNQAITGGHYSTTIASGLVGPEGGQMLVDYTVQYLNELWD
ncbi:MAG: hypothetical protein SCM11_16860 [Bacillota bacterium]|nr:hypothetical protein [Bacillota bacterium]